MRMGLLASIMGGLFRVSLTAASGSLYSLLLEQGIDAFWLLKIHTGKFGPINLQPYYSLLLGGLTLVVIVSGLAMFLSSGRART
jgi:hypothetical protein